MSYPSAYPDWFRSLVATAAIAALIGVISAAILLVTGCASWSHPTKPASAFYQDEYACDKDVAATQDPMRAMMMKDRCMRLKGWRQ